jgi:glycosyltransferase involved in cell wall biosynthesis
MQSLPFFTVVIPTYNRADLLPDAIESVLKQTFQDFEILVVDNFSSDNTPEVMKQYETDSRIHYFRNGQNMERAYSRNVGLKNAKGEFLTLLDSDDIIYPDCLHDAHEYITHNPGKKIFHNLYEWIDQQARPVKKIKFPTISNQYRQICKGNFLSCIGVFLQQDIYKIFFFNEDLKMIGSEDYEIWFRILAHHSMGRIDKVNCGVREHVGRSVYSSMYENLEYQRQKLIELLEGNSIIKTRYQKYIGYVNANYYFHEAMYSLHKKEKKAAMQQFIHAVLNGKGFLFSKRFFGFIKNFLFKR